MKVLTVEEIHALAGENPTTPAATINYLANLTATMLEGTSIAMIPDDIRGKVIAGAMKTLQAVNAIVEDKSLGTQHDINSGLLSALAVTIDLANQANNRLVVLVTTLAKIGVPIDMREIDMDLTSRLKQALNEKEKAA